MRLSSLFQVAIFASLFIYFSCKKETENKPNPNPTDTTKNPIDTSNNWPSKADSLRADSIFKDVDKLTKEDSQIDNEIEDITGIHDEIMIRGNINFLSNSTDTIRINNYDGCANVLVVPKASNAEGVVIVNFGNGCTSINDQRIRKGKIKWTYTKKFHEKGAELKTSFENYKVRRNLNFDSVMFGNNSSIITTVLDTNSLGLVIKREINLNLSYGDGSSFSSNGTQNLNLDLDEIAYKLDNTATIKIGSTATGSDRNGKNYTKTISSDVVRKGDCAGSGKFRPFSGKITYQKGENIMLVDFGSGACNGIVTTTYKGRTKKTDW